MTVPAQGILAVELAGVRRYGIKTLILLNVLGGCACALGAAAARLPLQHDRAFFHAAAVRVVVTCPG